MAKDTDIKEDVDASLAALQRLRARRASLLEEVRQIDESLEAIQGEIAAIRGPMPSASTPPPIPFRPPVRRPAGRDSELTVNDAVLQTIQEARKEVSKSDVRIRAMKLAGPFSESALNAALAHWLDEKEIRSATRGYYTAA